MDAEGPAAVAVGRAGGDTWGTMVVLLLWLILLALSPVLALVGLLLLPVVWLAGLPLRLVGVSAGVGFRLAGFLLGLPLRLLRAPGRL